VSTNAVFGVRAELRDMPAPAAVAYVAITVLTLIAKTLGYVFGLLAEITERLADAGYVARTAAAEHATQHADLTPPAPFTTARSGRTYATRSAR
jgi:hypothetical protein